MAKLIKPTHGYAVITKKGDVLAWTVSPQRNQAVDAACSNYRWPWKTFYRLGYRCVRITITVTKKGKR